MKSDEKSANIEIYRNIYSVISDWVSSIYADKFKRLFKNAALLMLFYLFTMNIEICKNIFYVLISLWGIIIVATLIGYNRALSRLDMKDGMFDKYLNMISANAKRYKILPDESSFIMIGAGDIVGDYLRQIDDSIGRGRILESPYMIITDEYLVSRSASSLQFNPVVISKSMVESISFFDKGILSGAQFGVYEFIDLRIVQISEAQRVKSIKRVLARKGMIGRKATRIGKGDPFKGLNQLEDNKYDGAVQLSVRDNEL